jgi:hypothetical protein
LQLHAMWLAGLLTIASGGAALADESVAGDWRAKLSDDVRIEMNVTADGHWSSETHQHDRMVRQMSGNYRQTHAGRDAGTLVFTPTRSSGGRARVETDRYRLSDNGDTLRLTAEGDTMVFERRQH